MVEIFAFCLFSSTLVPSEVFNSKKMSLGEKVGDLEVQEIHMVEVFSSEERRHPEEELTVQPQVEENQVNTVVSEDKNCVSD